MKKFLLSISILTVFFSASAQNKFVIYDGSDADILKGNAYSFNGFNDLYGGITKSDSTVSGNTFWYLEGAVADNMTYFVGGTSNANFQTMPNIATPFGINLKILETASFSFKYSSNVEVNIDVELEQHLFNSKGNDSTVLIGIANINLKPTLTSVMTEVVKPVSIFKNRTADLTAEDFAKVSKFTIIVSLTTKNGTVIISFDDITFTDGTTSVYDEIFTTSANENIIVYNLHGRLVTTGTIENLNLPEGLYFFKTETNTKKVYIK